MRALISYFYSPPLFRTYYNMDDDDNSTQNRDLYALLGLSSTNRTTYTSRDITLAYRRCALLHHPDKNPSPQASKTFASIFDAYEILSDETQRALYDSRLQKREDVERKWRGEEEGRRRLREDLERRERGGGAAGGRRGRERRERRLREEIERLREVLMREERRGYVERMERVRRRKEEEVGGDGEIERRVKEFREGVGMRFEEFERRVLGRVEDRIGELEREEKEGEEAR